MIRQSTITLIELPPLNINTSKPKHQPTLSPQVRPLFADDRGITIEPFRQPAYVRTVCHMIVRFRGCFILRISELRGLLPVCLPL